MNNLIRFKTDEERQEFYDERLDPRLRCIIYGLAGFLYDLFEYKILITEVWRSDEEQENIYYGQDSIPSNIHGDWRAVDLRDADMTEDIRLKAYQFLSHFVYTGDKKTTLRHNVIGIHFHIQVSPSDGTNLIKGEE